MLMNATRQMALYRKFDCIIGVKTCMKQLSCFDRISYHNIRKYASGSGMHIFLIGDLRRRMVII